MIATRKLTEYGAQRGNTRSDSFGHISVGNYVAFATHNYCSPDGRSSGRGVDLMSATVLYQEDLILEEYTESIPCRALVRHDTAEVVKVEDYFLYSYYSGVARGTFLCSVLSEGIPRLNVWLNYSGQRIVQLKNGSWLHIYSLNDEAIRAVEGAKSFLHGCALIKAAYRADQDKYNNWKGQTLDYTETCSGWYKPSQGFGYWNASRKHEYDSTQSYHVKIRFADDCPEGEFNCYINGSPVSLNLKYGERPSVSLHYNGSGQEWEYARLRETSLKPGMVFQDGVDIYTKTMEQISATLAADRAVRGEKIEQLKLNLLANGWGEKQVERLIRTARGRVIVTLQQALKTALSVEDFISLSRWLGDEEDVRVVRNTLN